MESEYLFVIFYQTSKKNCRYFEWKDDAQEDGHYKQILLSTKRRADGREDAMVIGNYRRRIGELEGVVIQQKEEYSVELSKRDEAISLERAQHDRELLELKAFIWRLKKVVACLAVLVVVSYLR